MTEPKKWAAGVADEPWKVAICNRDVQEAARAISWLAYVLDNPGNVSLEAQADVIRRFSGGQIADALLAYREKSLRSIPP